MIKVRIQFDVPYDGKLLPGEVVIQVYPEAPVNRMKNLNDIVEEKFFSEVGHSAIIKSKEVLYMDIN